MNENERLIEAIIEEMGPLFCEGVFTTKSSFRFTLGETSITLLIDGDSYSAERDAPLTKVDCSCATNADIFAKIWYDGYRPGIMDFLGGAIRCDNPLLLPRFLKAFGK